MSDAPPPASGALRGSVNYSEQMRHFKPPPKHFGAAGHWQWHEMKAQLDPQPTSTALGLQAMGRRRAVEGEQGRKHMRIGSVNRFRTTHKMDKERRVVAQSASTRTRTLHLWCQRATRGNRAARALCRWHGGLAGLVSGCNRWNLMEADVDRYSTRVYTDCLSCLFPSNTISLQCEEKRMGN